MYPPRSPIEHQLLRLRLHQASSTALALALRQCAHNAPRRSERRRLLAQSRRIASCAASFYAKAVTPPNEPTRIDIRHPRDCRHPLCQLSNRFKAARARKKTCAIIERARDAHPEAPLVFLTLTARNRPWHELPAMLDDLARAQERFWRLREIKRAYIGSITAHEIVCRGTPEQPQAGAHTHVLVACHPDYFDFSAAKPRYLSQQRLTVLFQRTLRADYPPILHISRVRDLHGGTGPESIGWALRELNKYCTKPAELFRRGTKGLEADPHIIGVLANTLHRRRMLRIAGIFATSSRAINTQAKEEKRGAQSA